MQRVAILGCCGAGKSTFARKLHKLTNLHLIHLDQHYWKPNWVESDSAEWADVHDKLIAKSSWIIDGNYGSSLKARIIRADTIIYLDFPTWKCLYRVLKRIVQYRGTVRPDMVDGCPERFDLEFLHYVATFNLRKRKKTIQEIRRFSDTKNVYVLQGDQQVRDFLHSV